MRERENGMGDANAATLNGLVGQVHLSIVPPTTIRPFLLVRIN